MTAERPANLKEALNALSNEQLKGIISWADSRQTDRRAEPPAPQPATPVISESKRSEQGLGGAVRRFVSRVTAPAEHAAPKRSFIEEIDDSLASAEEPARKVFVTPRTFAWFLQTLPLPQSASLQNLNIEILDGRSARAQGTISKAGTSGFVVMLGADQDDGDLKVVSTGLTNVALTHRGHTGEITEHLGNLIPTLQKQLDNQIADKTWKATGFSISQDHQELVVNFENGGMEKARKDLAEIGVKSLRHWMTRFNLERPKLSDLARPTLQDQGTQEPSQEQLDNFAPQWVQWLADQIEKGRVPPGNSAALELFSLLHEDDAQAVKVMIGEKLAAAGDTPWASAWRNYLTPPPNFPNPEPATAGPSTTETKRPSPEQIEGAEAVIAELMKGGKTRFEAITYLADLDRRNREQAES